MDALSSTLVSHVLRFSSSICIEPQDDSTMALSYASPMAPSDWMSPLDRTFWEKAHEVY